MTWEETIQYIRTKEEYKDLVRLAYLDADLPENVELYKSGNEYRETIKIIKKFAPKARNILDVGCGNGITSISFALDGYTVTSVEPDKSETIGAGAIKKLKNHYNLSNISVYEDFAENIKFPDNSFDIVFARQSMHHANDLNKFVAEMARVLKSGGLFLTVRDHVIYNEEDKKWFLENHPLQKYYGGENAFTSEQYKNAISQAGLSLQKELKFYDSEINYFPGEHYKQNRKQHLKNKIGFLANLPFVLSLYNFHIDKKTNNITYETNIPGRMYSYIALKK